jgi:uronate dehydrogenase
VAGISAAGHLVITGCAGRVAAMIAPHLRPRFRVTGIDLERPGRDVVDEFVHGDVRDIDGVATVLTGADSVLHLAAQPAEADFRDRLLPRNLDGTWAVFEAAVRAGVRRFVFASTLQTIQGYDRGERVPPNAAPRPTSVYGATKLFGEALGRYHADRSGLGVACLRLGAVRTSDAADARENSSIWLGAHDLARLVGAAVESGVPFAIVTAVSPPATERFDTANPFGWSPSERPTGT